MILQEFKHLMKAILNSKRDKRRRKLNYRRRNLT